MISMKLERFLGQGAQSFGRCIYPQKALTLLQHASITASATPRKQFRLLGRGVRVTAVFSSTVGLRDVRSAIEGDERRACSARRYLCCCSFFPDFSTRSHLLLVFLVDDNGPHGSGVKGTEEAAASTLSVSTLSCTVLPVILVF